MHFVAVWVGAAATAGTAGAADMPAEPSFMEVIAVQRSFMEVIAVQPSFMAVIAVRRSFAVVVAADAVVVAADINLTFALSRTSSR
jgi:hypothetical protein